MISPLLIKQVAKRSMNIRYNKEVAMHTLKLVQIGNSVGVVLPKDVLARLKLEKGESVFLTDTPYGVAITPYDPAIDDQIAAGREFMREYRDTFHALAK
jgi:putative addiction module antidote